MRDDIRDWTAVRRHLVGVARRAGLDEPTAEDLAQDAIVATLAREGLHHPVSYALVSLQRMIALRRRDATTASRGEHGWLLRAWNAPLIPSIELISISAAVEQLGVWGDGGSTKRVILPDENLDELARRAVETWERLLSLLDAESVSERQRRRYRVRAAELLRDTIEADRAGVIVLDPVADAERIHDIRVVLHAEPSEPRAEAERGAQPDDPPRGAPTRPRIDRRIRALKIAPLIAPTPGSRPRRRIERRLRRCRGHVRRGTPTVFWVRTTLVVPRDPELLRLNAIVARIRGRS